MAALSILLVRSAVYVKLPDELLRPEVLSRVSRTAAVDWTNEVAGRCGEATPLSRALHYNFLSYLPYDLMIKADRASMLHGLELRSPFLDTALIEYVARLPDSMKRRGLATKWILRRAFADMLPEAILRRVAKTSDATKTTREMRPGDILFEDFRKPSFERWHVNGLAFAAGPIGGMANSFRDGSDKPMGTLTS